jgi:cob(I)alamin adenosyltransferase
MVILNRIYTRTGDDGTTALGSGERRPKYDLRVSAYGTVDETNAAIGVARLHLAQVPLIDAMLGRCRTICSISAPIWRFRSVTEG